MIKAIKAWYVRNFMEKVPTDLERMAQQVKDFRDKYMELARLAHCLPESEFKQEMLLLVGLQRRHLFDAEELLQRHQKMAEYRKVLACAEEMLMSEDAMRGGL